MATRAERRALLFFAAVIALGAGVRFARAARRERPTLELQGALAAQIAAVDSLAARPRRSGARRPRAPTVARSRVSEREPIPRVLRAPREKPRREADPSPAAPVDVDRASAAELERLPRVGPVLARRIIADRDSLGPFGSLEGFARVRGVGPRMLELLRDRVTFSGTARPDNAAGRSPRASPSARQQQRRRSARS